MGFYESENDIGSINESSSSLPGQGLDHVGRFSDNLSQNHEDIQLREANFYKNKFNESSETRDKRSSKNKNDSEQLREYKKILKKLQKYKIYKTKSTKY